MSCSPCLTWYVCVQITTCRGIVMGRLRSPQRQLEVELMRFCHTKLGAPGQGWAEDNDKEIVCMCLPVYPLRCPVQRGACSVYSLQILDVLKAWLCQRRCFQALWCCLSRRRRSAEDLHAGISRLLLTDWFSYFS